MVKKFSILYALFMWLFFDKHFNGVKFSINHINGDSWFLVEPEVVWLYADASPYARAMNGGSYVRVGGGAHEGKWLKVSDSNIVSLNDVADEIAECEPRVDGN